jgi:hypothetical protein
MEAVSNAWHSLAIKPKKMRNHGGEELGKTGGNWTRKPEAKKSKAGGGKKREQDRKKKGSRERDRTGETRKKDFRSSVSSQRNRGG